MGGRHGGDGRAGPGARAADRPRRRAGLGAGVGPHGVERSAAVVLGVLLALASATRWTLNGLTVGALVAVSLGVAELVLRLPRAAARQVPVSLLVVLSAIASNQEQPGRRRAVDTSSERRSALWSRSCCRRRGWSTRARRWTGWRAGSTACSSDGCRAAPAVVDGPDRGVAATARTARDGWSTRRSRLSATAARPPAGTSAIGATSTARSLRGCRAAPRADGHRRLGHLPGSRRSRPPGRHDPPGDARHGRAARSRWRTRSRALADDVLGTRARKPMWPIARRGPRPDGIDACGARPGGRGWPSTTNGRRRRDRGRSGSATPRCWCRSTGSSATSAPHCRADGRPGRTPLSDAMAAHGAGGRRRWGRA